MRPAFFVSFKTISLVNGDRRRVQFEVASRYYSHISKTAASFLPGAVMVTATLAVRWLFGAPMPPELALLEVYLVLLAAFFLCGRNVLGDSSPRPAIVLYISIELLLTAAHITSNRPDNMAALLDFSKGLLILRSLVPMGLNGLSILSPICS